MRQSLFFVIRGETRIERRRKPEKGSSGAFSARRDSGASSLVLGKKTEVPIGASVFFAIRDPPDKEVLNVLQWFKTIEVEK